MADASGLATNVIVRGAQMNYRAYQWNGRNRMRKYDGENWRNAGIATPKTNAVLKALTSNVVTITTDVAHRLTAGDVVVVSLSPSDTTFDGRFTVASAPTSTTFTYSKTASNVSSAETSGSVRFYPKTAAATPSGSGITGDYYYYIQAVNENHRTRSGDYVMSVPTPISDEVRPSSQKVTVSGIPATHADAQVTHWHIFRNKSGEIDALIEDDLQDFFYVGRVAIGTQTYDDETEDNSLSAVRMDPRREIPPTAKYGEVFGHRLLLCGFDPITTGTVSKNGTSGALLDFSAVTLPDGVVGCKFQADGDDVIYEVVGNASTTQVTLDKPYSGALSGASYSIFRDQSEIWMSAWRDFDSWGPRGEHFRYNLPVGAPGSNHPIKGIKELNGYCYVFTETKIFRLYGKGPDILDIKITPDPIFDGIGTVSGDTLVTLDNSLHWLSLVGPVQFDGQHAPKRTGDVLGTDWLDDLNASQLAITCGGTDGRDVFFAVPRGSDTENGMIWWYQRLNNAWWPIYYVHPRVMWTDKDSDNKQRLFWGQGKGIVKFDPDATNDGIPSGTTSGTATGGSTTTVADTGASFYTTDDGLFERYVHVYTSTGTLRGHGRVSSNTGTVLTFAYEGSDGTQDTVVAGDVYYLGPILWHWKSKTYITPGKMQTIEGMDLVLDLEGTSNNLVKTDYAEDTAASSSHTIPINQSHKVIPVQQGGLEYAYKIENREVDSDVVIREIVLRGDVGGSHT